MRRKNQKTVYCQICKKQKQRNETISMELISEPLAKIIQKKHPNLAPSSFVCLSDLNRIRTEYVREVLETDKGELSRLEEEVLQSLKEHELLSENINIEFDRSLTFGERLSDKLAEFGGSWGFIISFACMLIL